jgi:hypothetical protein
MKVLEPRRSVAVFSHVITGLDQPSHKLRLGRRSEATTAILGFALLRRLALLLQLGVLIG